LLGLSEHDRSLGIMSPATISGLRAMLATLHAGAFSILRDPRTGLSRIIETLRNERVTIFRCVPALMRAIARVDGARAAMRELRVFHLGGERVYATDIALLRPLLPRACRISIGYGSTESGLVAQWFVDDAAQGVVHSGYPTPGTTLEVIAPDGTPVAAGETGELRSCGPLTAVGFWDGERALPGGLTALPGDPQSRVCLTGDLFRRRMDGLLEHAGRVDRMVKIRGQRVDLGDVEAAIRACRGVRDAAVAASTADGSAEITAFIVCASRKRLTAAAVRRALRSQLPEHMLPAHVHCIDAIPHLPGFKPDVAELERLAAASRSRRTLPSKRAAPRDGDVARAVAAVWTELLGSESLENDERWDDAGGNSLHMLQLAYGLERILRRPVSLEAMRPDMRASEFVDGLKNVHARAPASPPSARTVILLPGLRGDEPKLVQFRKLFDGDACFYLPAYTEWDELVRRDASLAAIVEDVTAQIRANVLDRPFILVGYSFGGLIAHEVARRFELAHDAIAFVGILDTNLTSTRWQSSAEETAPGGRERFARDVRNHGLRKTLAIRAGYRLALTVYRLPPLRRAVARYRLPLPSEVAFAFHYYMTWFVRAALVTAWQPGSLSARVTLFRSRARGDTTEPDLGWGQYTSSLDVEDALGTHDTMLVGHDGEQLARKLELVIAPHL